MASLKKLIAFLLIMVLTVISLPLNGLTGLETIAYAQSYKPGDSVYFGTYPQSYMARTDDLKSTLAQLEDDDHIARYNGCRFRENYGYWLYSPIEWVVLQETSDSLFLLSKRILVRMAFGGQLWPDSDIRTWLNNDFYNDAFSEAEQKDIKAHENLTFNLTYNDVYIDRKEGTYVSTKDNVYLLSDEEVVSLIDNSSSVNLRRERIAHNTKFVDSSRSVDTWYLRGRLHWNYGSLQQKYINKSGEESYWYGTWDEGIRPVIRVNKKSKYLLSDISDFDAEGKCGIDKRTFGKDTDVEENINFGKNNLNSVYVELYRNWFGGSNKTYHHGLATFCSDFAMLGYAKKEAKFTEYLEQCGFEVYDGCLPNLHAERDEVNTFVALKTITVDGKKRNLIFVGTIGSFHEQWYSDFDPYGKEAVRAYADRRERDSTHISFADARDYAYYMIKKVVTDNYLDFEPSDNIFVFTGHSRGAAAANLLAAKIIDQSKWVDPDSVYAYTFATPRATKKDNIHSERYGCIFNILNPEDFVTNVMLKSWGYDRYGTDYTLPSKTNTSYMKYREQLALMNNYFKNYANGTYYHPYDCGEVSTWAAVKLMSTLVPTVDDFYEKQFPYIGITAIDGLRYLIEENLTGADGNVPEVPLLPFMSPYRFFTRTVIKILAEKDHNMSKAADALYELIHVCMSNLSVFYKMLTAYFFNATPEAVTDLDKILKAFKFEKLIDFANAHGVETYCSYMHALTGEAVTATKRSLIGAVNCPVDVEIYDSATGQIVGKITDNVIDEQIAIGENSVAMYVDGDSKYYFLPCDGDYKVVLTGSDEGSMDYSVSTYENSDEVTNRLNYYDVDIQANKSMEMAVEHDVAVSDLSLTGSDGKTIEPDEYIADTSDSYKEVRVSVDGSGYVSGDGAYLPGDHVTLSAYAQCSDFLGWFDDDDLVCSDNEYTIKVENDVRLSARFTDGDHEMAAVSCEADCISGGFTANQCAKCGYTEDLEETDPLGHDFGDWTVTEVPDVDSAGTEVRECVVCSSNEERQIPELSKLYTIDDDTGVRVFVPETVYSTGNVRFSPDYINIKAEKINEGELYQSLAKKFDGLSVELFDISVTIDRRDVMQGNNVILSLPVGEGSGGEALAVYYVSDDGSFERMLCKTDDGYVSFGTLVSGKFALVDEYPDSVHHAGRLIAGDVNGDNKILADDARLALRASAKLQILDVAQSKAADVNEDGSVLADDARQILRYSAKLQDSFEKSG